MTLSERLRDVTPSDVAAVAAVILSVFSDPQAD
jgi:hypothetical protein